MQPTGPSERRRLVTSVFCDLSGSTALAERVDAEAVYGVMRRYFDEARLAFERHGGTVEKFIGDAVVGMFGIPEAHEDDAMRACRAALEIQGRIGELNVDLERRFGTQLAVRIGVNSGEVVAGGGTGRDSFATGDAVVLGDAVNVAARLEQAASPGEVLIGETTYRFIRDAASVELLEPLEVKGKSEPLVAYRLTALSGLGRPSSRNAATLVGRSVELQLLEQELEAVMGERRCRVVTVVGEPGVGKSRLAAELLDTIGSRAAVARGGCLSYGEGITYWALAQIVRELAGIGDDQSAEAARDRLESFVRDAPDAPEVTAQIARLLGIGDGVTTAEELAWAVRRFLAAAVRERPLVLVVDDIQWAEPALLDLIAGTPAALEWSPLLVCCLARPELLENSPEWPVTVRLEPLGATELDQLLGELGVPADERGVLARASAGNPLFAEELVEWASEAGGETGALPATLNALLGARLDRLDAQVRDALERGAIEGEIFHRAAVVELSDPDARPSVPGRLEVLANRDLIRPATGSLAGEAAFRFKHILVRDAAYGATAKKVRAVLHERLAGWLERLVGDRLAEYEEIVGYHLEQSYRFRTEVEGVDDEIAALGERGAGHLQSAAHRAGARGDYAAAASILRRALGIGLDEARTRIRAELDLHRYLISTGRLAECTAVAADALEAATALGDSDLVARVRVAQVGNSAWDRSLDRDETVRVLEEAVGVFDALGDQSGLAAAYQAIGQVLLLGRVGEKLAVYERALSAAELAGDLQLRRTVTSSTAYALHQGPTPADEGIDRCQELIRRNPGDRAVEALVTRCMASLLAMTGRAEQASGLIERSSRVLDELGMSTISREASAEALEYAGNIAGAIREHELKWEELERRRAGRLDARAMHAAEELGLIQCDLGNWGEAARCAAYGPDDYQPPLRLACRARIAAHEARHDEAASLVGEAVAEIDRTDLLNRRASIWRAAAEVHRAGGRHDEADTAVGRALELYAIKGNVAGAAAVRARYLPM
jgi:class 3 adenylate cyclase/tetratricopeptide (TPR) repeat protein